jgi:hypothetical protein
MVKQMAGIANLLAVISGTPNMVSFGAMTIANKMADRNAPNPSRRKAFLGFDINVCNKLILLKSIF